MVGEKVMLTENAGKRGVFRKISDHLLLNHLGKYFIRRVLL
jgi:hypothetical protein